MKRNYIHAKMDYDLNAMFSRIEGKLVAVNQCVTFEPK